MKKAALNDFMGGKFDFRIHSCGQITSKLWKSYGETLKKLNLQPFAALLSKLGQFATKANSII